MPRDELFTLEDHAVRACLAAVARDLAQHSAVALHRGCGTVQQEGFTPTFDQMHRRLGPFPFVGSRPGTGNAIWAGCAGQP
jgi:hypothetical protein